MTRHRAQRLAEIARSRGVRAEAVAPAPSRPGASTPFLYVVKIHTKRSREAVWCYSTTHFFSLLKTLLAYQPETEQ